jgi:hypothetical protein
MFVCVLPVSGIRALTAATLSYTTPLECRHRANARHCFMLLLLLLLLLVVVVVEPRRLTTSPTPATILAPSILLKRSSDR